MGSPRRAGSGSRTTRVDLETVRRTKVRDLACRHCRRPRCRRGVLTERGGSCSWTHTAIENQLRVAPGQDCVLVSPVLLVFESSHACPRVGRRQARSRSPIRPSSGIMNLRHDWSHAGSRPGRGTAAMIATLDRAGRLRTADAGQQPGAAASRGVLSASVRRASDPRLLRPLTRTGGVVTGIEESAVQAALVDRLSKPTSVGDRGWARTCPASWTGCCWRTRCWRPSRG